MSPFYNRSSGYDVTGALVSAGSTLVARNTIASGCGDVCVGLDAAGARTENNFIQGGCARNTAPFPPSYVIHSTAMIARGGEVHSNNLASPSPGGGLSTSTGLDPRGTTARNNVIAGIWASVLSTAGTFQNNDVLPSNGITASQLNALPDSAGNFDDRCYPAGDTSGHLNAGSPCIDAGTQQGAPLDDFDGETRDSAPDVGPDEYSLAHDPCAGITCSGHGSCALLPDMPCLCDEGYWPSASDPTACVVNQCLATCDPLVVCTRDGDNAVCGDCPLGYDGTGDTACVDIDECATDNGGCDPLSTCTNSAGSHSCGPCPPGYAGTGATGCTPSSACTPNPCENGGTCVPEVSSFTCTCPPGITGSLCEHIFTELSLGEIYLCGIRDDGALLCRNDFGIDVSVPSGTFTSVSSSNYHYCALATDGTIACAGTASFGETTPPPGTFTDVDTAHFHTCAVATGGTLQCFGLNVQGSTQPPGGTFTAVAVGDLNSCALATDGTLQCFGVDTHGESTPPSGAFTALALGSSHGCALATDGTVACWGQNDWGEATAPSGTFLAVDAAGWYSCGLRTDGTIACWGRAPSGGPPAGHFVALAAGYSVGGDEPNACAIRDDNVVVCWGAGAYTPPAGGS
ncbi:MAG TPA: choice-of-anchor Q domain-containing protein [Polyangiaceae bacterium]|nr:choice-of-anchor Q domain-containing protein [Polyangiaceae bacterium]